VCPHFKMELQHRSCILLGNYANTTIYFVCMSKLLKRVNGTWDM
jgi:hypothetical protein